ncbi:MAG: hypothetical protein MZV64_62375 [Ignavibacteriales bacterium]|nr:hypothetical protein [Ignavibacteriales bacterium]
MLKVTPLIRERLVTLDDCLTFASFFFQEDVQPNPEDLVAKGLDAKQSAEIARKTYEILVGIARSDSRRLPSRPCALTWKGAD